MKKTILFLLSFIVVSGAIVVFPGCGTKAPEGFPKTYPAEMEILYQGKPYSDAKVFLRSSDGGSRWSVGGDLTPSGKFQFTTVQGSYSVVGIPAGEYAVMLNFFKIVDVPIPDKIAALPPEEQSRYVTQQEEILTAKAKAESKIPPSLANFDSTQVRWTITSGGPNQLVIELDKY